MKIGFFSDTYLPAFRGIEISMETFRKTFEKMDHEVFVYAQKVPDFKDKNKNVFRFSSFLVNRAPEMRLVVPLFPQKTLERAKKNKLDIVHVHTPFSVGLLGKSIAKKQNIPMVYTHHTRYPELAKLYFKEKYILPHLAKSICSYFANSSDAVIAPSLKIKKYLRSYYHVSDSVPIHVVLTGIDLKKFKPSDENRFKLRQELKIDQRAKVLLFVGSVNAVKNSAFLFKAAKFLVKGRKDIVVLMVGDGDLREGLVSQAKKLKLEDRIKLVGAVPYKQIPQYYQAADMFAFPSLTDTQGIVLLEAMATGLPVITLKDDAFANVVLDNENGFIVPRQSAQLFADRARKVLDDEELYTKFSLAAKNTALKYSKENEAAKLAEIYKKLIKKRKKL